MYAVLYMLARARGILEIPAILSVEGDGDDEMEDVPQEASDEDVIEIHVHDSQIPDVDESDDGMDVDS